ncbi:HAD-IIA family hydrolase [Cohnella algarum]|uniref:HAD-IIA family hydrolase n=1 Tax=Cohnella algarum TaxID=2044859 RepID=UPI001966E850|nr:HAD-IIA family hydrolase [Cohnella algarum]MBN2983907.1 HAD-IIA family hydrolase [Cohnella algarum]
MEAYPIRPPERTLPKALLFDLDGTLYKGDTPIPGADRLIAKMEEIGLPCWFVTNNSTRTPAQVADHLNKMGIPASAGQVVTSAQAAAEYAKRHYPGAPVFLVGEHGIREALREAGLRLLDEADETDARLVVQGIDRALTFDRLTVAVRHLLRGAAFLLTNPDRLLPMGTGLLPGAGSIAALLEAASGTKPTVVGKPSPILMDYALARAGVSAGDAWVIGDNPHTDIAAGKAAGSPTVLVLTGLCSEADWRIRCEDADVKPDGVCADLDQLADWIANDR